ARSRVSSGGSASTGSPWSQGPVTRTVPDTIPSAPPRLPARGVCGGERNGERTRLSRSPGAHRMAGPCPAPGGADARAVLVVPAPDPAHGSVASAHGGPLAAAHLAAPATHRLLRRRRRDRLAGRRGDAVVPAREAARSRPSPCRAAGRGDPG